MILEHFKVPPKDRVLVSEAELRRTVTQIFEKLGVSPKDSAEGADVLTMTDLRGVETHGVSNMLRAYVRDFKAGKLDPRPGWRVVRGVGRHGGDPTFAAKPLLRTNPIALAGPARHEAPRPAFQAGV